MAFEGNAHNIDRDLVRKRAAIKTKLSHFKKFVTSIHESEEIPMDQLKLRIAQIEHDFQTFQSVQEALELNADDNGFEARLNERESFESSYYQIVAVAKRIEREYECSRGQVDPATAANIQFPHVPQPSGLSDGIFNAQSPFTVASELQVKLPTMHLPKFGGSYESWPGFSDTFKSAIHDNPNFRDVQKLMYLKSCLTGKAAEKVESLETTSVNYSVAWNILEKHYNDPSVVINNRIQAFFELPACPRYNSAALGELTDEASKHYNALKALNKPFLESFPIYAITSKLDEQTRLRWKEKTQGSALPTMEELLDFLHNRCRVLETSKSETVKPVTRSQTNPSVRNRQTSNSNVHAFAHSAQQARCFMCKGNHFTQYCQKLTNANIDQRAEMIRKAGLCFNCLRPNHDIKACTAGSCKRCNEKHHTLLHKESAPVQSAVSSVNANIGNETLLSTAIVHVQDSKGLLHPCRVLLDSGSQSHFMTQRFATKLALRQKKGNIPVVGINRSTTKTMNTVRSTIRSRINNFSADLTFLILPNITEILPSHPISKTALQIPSNIPLADPNFNTPAEIDALIGAEIFFNLLCVGQIKIANNSVTIQKTKLGWVLAGTIPDKGSVSTTRCHVARNSLDARVSRFWEIEEVPQEIVLSHEERACESHYIEHTTRDSSTGKYIVKLPFKSSPPALGESYGAALRRLQALERKFVRDPSLKSEYTKFLNEYRELGHMTKVESSRAQEGYYLPHHAISKTDSLTTKLRVVFDASAKSSNEKSLNDMLLVGPTVQDDLSSLLIRFRAHAYVLTADIEKMYRQVEIHPQDRIYQKILWREGTDQPIDTYTLNTVTYGTSAAPFLATRTLVQLAADEGEQFARASRVLREDFYVDDMLTGADTYNDAAAIRDEIRALCAKGGFQLRKWATNDESLTADLDDRTDATHMTLDLDKTIKTLGVHWNARNDTLSYVVKEVGVTNRPTKRNILSKIATLFDPLGILGPIIIRAKLIMQSLWRLQLDWDESVPTDIHTEWTTFWQELQTIHNLNINRHILQQGCTSIQLHGFCDASERAYGACLYLRSVNHQGNVVTRLVVSKSRVAPLKSITLPRLELCAAQLLAKLYNSMKKALRNTNFDRTIFWSDSTVTLHWIKAAPHTLKTFVSHRVSDIQTLTAPHEWLHIASADNPADLISRGMRTGEFIASDLWHHGPAWLSLEEENCPVPKLAIVEIPELRPIVSLTIQMNDLGFLERFSSFHRLKRVVAYMVRFVQNSLKRASLSGPLTTIELRKSEQRIVMLVQRQAYQKELSEIKSTNRIASLSSLTPFLDVDGMLRVGGRLSKSKLSFGEKHPILLPKNHHVTKLIVRDEHIRNMHIGIQSTLNAIRKKYWIPHGKSLIRQVIHNCVTCRRAKPATIEYPMGDLPASRITYSRPFSRCGVDYCGPLFIKEKLHRNRGKVKVYLAIFTCFATRAVHIEVVSDLSTEAFLAALRRFFARRGKANDIYSDNATNFIGAKRELKELYEFLENPQTQQVLIERLSDQHINWHLIPPRSPHFGGIWEAAVKSTKHHLTRVMGDALLSFEGLLTLTVQIEAILNSRPLTPVSSDPNDLTAITPSHFLIGESLTNVPDYDFTNLPDGRLSSWQHIQKIKAHFWKRWKNEYLQELTVRKKWHTNGPPQLPIGTMVLVREDNTPPMQWPLGRITAIHPGADGTIRVVTIRTSRGKYKRSVKRIAPLPVE